MKHTLTLVVLVLLTTVQAQETTYNRFSLDAQFGLNNPVSPMATGYDAPTFGLFHVGLGGRYMFNPKFGLRLGANYDQLNEADGSSPFRTSYYRTSLEGVVNLGNVLDFNQWTKRFGILLHAGLGYSTMKGDDAVGHLTTSYDHMLSVVGGITPQVKLSERWNIYLDVTAVAHVYQEYSYDFTRKISDPGFDGYLYNFSLGLQYNFGKNLKHADWVSVEGLNQEEMTDLKQRIKTLEDQQRDDDGDGVANYLDQEPNTPPGTTVNTKGQTVVAQVEQGDNRTNGGNDDGKISASSEAMVESSEVKFATDSYDVSSDFARMLDGIAGTMNEDPSSALTIIGHADDRGSDVYNQQLSEKRAAAVRDYLVSKGISSSRLAIKGVGESQPKSGSRSLESLAENRRVQFVVR